jgi:Protein of unknown function (DUF3048) N-terminal domain/Protein of unknown function (DUF3048) C-terminal domain
VRASAGSGNLEWEWEVVHPMADTRQPELLRRRWVWGVGIGVVVVVVVVALVLARGAGAPTTAPGGSPPAENRPTTFPLTGLPATNPALASRPALSIKVENVAAARPQAGLNSADMVTEELVEGGLTRLLVTYHSKDAPQVGPVRSVRPVDGLLLRQLGGGLFGFSGGAAGVLDVVQRTSDATFLSPAQAPGAYRRVSGRPAPHNLFTSTSALYEAGRSAGEPTPPALFTYADAAPANARSVTVARLRFSPSSRASWEWRSGEGFVRFQDGTLHRLVDGSPVTTQNVVVMSVTIGRTKFVDVAGNPTPDVDVIGEGTAWVLRDGKLVTGTWRRPAASDPVQVLGTDGEPIPLHTGPTWVELLPSTERPSFG